MRRPSSPVDMPMARRIVVIQPRGGQAPMTSSRPPRRMSSCRRTIARWIFIGGEAVACIWQLPCRFGNSYKGGGRAQGRDQQGERCQFSETDKAVPLYRHTVPTDARAPNRPDIDHRTAGTLTGPAGSALEEVLPLVGAQQQPDL